MAALVRLRLPARLETGRAAAAKNGPAPANLSNLRAQRDRPLQRSPVGQLPRVTTGPSPASLSAMGGLLWSVEPELQLQLALHRYS